MAKEEVSRAVLRYDEKTDEKGNKIWKPVYLKESPKDVIQRMNEQFTEWKDTKQVKYNAEGLIIEQGNDKNDK